MGVAVTDGGMVDSVVEVEEPVSEGTSASVDADGRALIVCWLELGVSDQGDPNPLRRLTALDDGDAGTLPPCRDNGWVEKVLVDFSGGGGGGNIFPVGDGDL